MSLSSKYVPFLVASILKLADVRKVLLYVTSIELVQAICLSKLVPLLLDWNDLT
jgi:hypothetical protein